MHANPNPHFCTQPSLSPAQRFVLANQVLASKVLREFTKKSVAHPLPDSWMARVQPPPLGSTAPLPTKISKKEQEEFLHIVAQTFQKQKQAQQQAQSQQPPKQQQQQRRPPSSQSQRQLIARADPLAPRPGPLFTTHAIPIDNPPLLPSGTGTFDPVEMDVNSIAMLMKSEYQRMIEHELHKKIPIIESTIANAMNADPGMRYKSPAPPLGAALLQLRLLRVLSRQHQLRIAIEAQGRELCDLESKDYKALRKRHRLHLIEMARREIATRAEIAAGRAKDVKELMSGAMKEWNQGIKDLRVARNRTVLRAHERLARDRNKLKEDDRSLRMAALKAHDFEAYQEMLRKQAGSTPAADERYAAISKFLADTEAYLHRLASKIASVKISAEASSAAARAMAEARARGLSEDEVHAAAHAAAAEATTGNEALRAAAEGAMDAQSRYYALAHSNTEEILEQPRLLRPPGNACLREYQIVGLQWMVSLYNNHLNGILADEMGLGKTVQVMSLIAYLMDKKANYGPHLIIVPNAVMVNWKSELTQWLPSARCVYYVGGKEERARKYTLEVQPLQFNVLVTTYEFIMRDRAKLSKIDWQYIIIDEAQRMKDRQSKLAKDLDRFSAARRLLLSGTPLQNDLQELWSLLNLLLPDVFDDKKLFSDWFGTIGGSGGGGGGDGSGGDDWLEKEKRVVVIHRLHQILEPFMLRRQVEDVESKLPAKVTHTVRVPMSAHQSMIYTWVKTTGTLRLDPAAPVIGKVRREFASLNNKCMELRKLCNHPMLSYPPPSWAVGPAIVRQCGKMVTLDRMLVKLRATGHRVLLFSAMTKLLDLLEVYLQWRALPDSLGGGYMNYLRIDGSTSLEDRETAIKRFNSPDSDCFVFLLSIRAAGRGLNLQTSDTVIIYDPDPNPKNEEQAIARSHRIGQSKEVRVFHLEAVTDAAAAAVAPAPAVAVAPAQTDNGNNASAGGGPKREGGEKGVNNNTATTAPPPLAPNTPPRRLYGDSIESVMRNQIQRLKIEMASEVIDAGRFDQRTSMEERRHTLENLLQDQDRSTKAVNTVPTPHELNEMLARTPEEMALFERLDKEEPGVWFDPTTIDEVPHWMRWTEGDLVAALDEQSKHKVDIEAEMAALMGLVMHHHAAPAGHAAKHVGPLQVKAGAGAEVGGATTTTTFTAAPSSSEGGVLGGGGGVFKMEPAFTTTTTRSLGGGDDEDEVGMVDNDEEEEVLDMNLIETNTEEGVGGGAKQDLRHIESTAAMKREGGDGSGGPLIKKQKSVHFDVGEGEEREGMEME